MTRTFLRLVLGGVTGKLLGLVREVLLAALFGAGRVVASSRIALTATLIPINFFTADALTAGFLPLYIQYQRDHPAAALALYRSLRRALTAFSLLLSVVLIAGSAAWVRVLGPGLDQETAAMAASMLAVAAVGVPFYIQFNLYALVALAHDDTRLVNMRASFQNVGLIVATLVAYLSGQVIWLAAGFTAPYMVLFAWGLLRTRSRAYLVLRDEPVELEHVDIAPRVVMSAFWLRLRPLLLIPIILQGSIAVERAVGSLLGVEVMAASEYARFVIDSFMALVAAPLGLASLSSFARVHTNDVLPRLRRLVSPILMATVPLSIMLSVSSTGVVQLVYGRGQFDAHAVATTSTLLLGFSLGMWAQVLGYTLVKVLNARGDNRRATVVTAASFACAIIVNLALYRPVGAFAIGLAASVCGLVMVLLSAYFLGVLRFSASLLGQMLPAVLVAALAGYVLAGPGIGHLFLASGAVAVIWFSYAALLPAPRRELLRAVKRKASDVEPPASTDIEHAEQVDADTSQAPNRSKLP